MAKNPFASILAGDRLSPEDSAELAAQVAQLARADLPLESGLLAVSQELRKGRLARVLSQVADQLRLGQPIDVALDSQKANIPSHLRGLIIAGVRTGRLADVLESYVDLQHKHQEIRRRVWLSMAYPICLVVILCFVFILLRSIFVMPFSVMLKEMDADLPAMTIAVIDLFHCGIWILPGVILVVLLFPLLFHLESNLRWASAILLRIPLFGPLLRWGRLSQFSHFMELLVGNQVPLPEALRMTADGLGNASLAEACREVAKDVESGRDFSESMASQPLFPPRMIPLIDWGRQSSSLADAFRGTAEMFDLLLHSRTTITQTIVIPLTFFSILTFVGATILAMFLPMLSLIACLSGGHRKHSQSHVTMETVETALADSGSLELITYFLAFLIVAISVWCLYRIRHGKSLPIREILNFLLTFLWIGAWALAILGSFSIAMLLFGPGIGLILWLVGWSVVIEIFRQCRIDRQYGLLWLLTVLADRSIPLAPSIEAFSKERRGLWRSRYLQLAKRLASGVSLPQALKNSGNLLPSKTLPIICAGCESGDLAGSLRKAAAGKLLLHPVWQSMIAKAAYLAMVMFFGLGCMIFLMVKIVPEFYKMFRELDAPMPQFTKVVVHGACWLVNYNVVTLLGFFLFFGFIYTWLRCMGIIHWNLPGLGLLMRRLDIAVILDTLAIVTHKGQPLSLGMDALQHSYPDSNIQKRLTKASEAMQHGLDWVGSLFAQGLLSRADSAVLRAAQRVGNLPWAMEEMADSNRRRFVYRVQIVLQTLFPILIILYGILAMVVAVALFAPLPALIESLV
jgi:type II secretory pathway component PulF